VIGLWPVRLADNLQKAIEQEDIRKVDLWTARFKLAVAEFSEEPTDPFFNVNRPDDLDEAERVCQVGVL
jgi:molybdopterin-guanine dinucleotide biosynthesis protein A